MRTLASRIFLCFWRPVLASTACFTLRCSSQHSTVAIAHKLFTTIANQSIISYSNIIIPIMPPMPTSPKGSPKLPAHMRKKSLEVVDKVEEILGPITHPISRFVPKIDPRSGRILVTGGTGVVGYRVATRVLSAGYPTVRVAVRDPGDVKDVMEGAEIVQFCWEKEETYQDALDGVQTVFLETCGHEDWESYFPAFLEAAMDAGVTHFVKLSFYHSRQTGDATNLDAVETDPFEDVDLVQLQHFCDKQIMKTPIGIGYTLLFASHFMSNPLRYQAETLRKEDKFYGASNLRGINYVSPNDVAEVAVRSLLAPKDHYRVTYTLTGPYAITDKDVANMLSSKLKKHIEYENRPASHFEKDFAALELVKANGSEEAVEFISPDIEKVCGRRAETFEGYLMRKELMCPRELKAFLP